MVRNSLNLVRKVEAVGAAKDEPILYNLPQIESVSVWRQTWKYFWQCLLTVLLAESNTDFFAAVRLSGCPVESNYVQILTCKTLQGHFFSHATLSCFLGYHLFLVKNTDGTLELMCSGLNGPWTFSPLAKPLLPRRKRERGKKKHPIFAKALQTLLSLWIGMTQWFTFNTCQGSHKWNLPCQKACPSMASHSNRQSNVVLHIVFLRGWGGGGVQKEIWTQAVRVGKSSQLAQFLTNAIPSLSVISHCYGISHIKLTDSKVVTEGGFLFIGWLDGSFLKCLCSVFANNATYKWASVTSLLKHDIHISLRWSLSFSDCKNLYDHSCVYTDMVANKADPSELFERLWLTYSQHNPDLLKRHWCKYWMHFVPINCVSWKLWFQNSLIRSYTTPCPDTAFPNNRNVCG